MRFPYMGTARVKYVVSMLEHRRLLRRLPRWATSPDFADTRVAGEPGDQPIETLPSDDESALFQPSRAWQDAAGARPRRH